MIFIILILLIGAIYLSVFLYGIATKLGNNKPIPSSLGSVKQRTQGSYSRERLIQKHEYPRYNPNRNDEEFWKTEVEPMYRRYSGTPPDWQRRRTLVFIRDEGRCQNEQCGRKCGKLACKPDQIWNFTFDEQLLYDAHVHHVKHRASGGDHGLENLRLYCPRCHVREHPENDALWAFVVSRALGGGPRRGKQRSKPFRMKAPPDRTVEDDVPF